MSDFFRKQILILSEDIWKGARISKKKKFITVQKKIHLPEKV